LIFVNDIYDFAVEPHRITYFAPGHTILYGRNGH
jgi:hypothetical protein